ncbi:MAG: TrkA family potassium uptake protein [Candidatus Amulumruptor caecigallinarius]|nr:TrkA family potassium uptake protein [Candidatus Amulumruptor caecigallinarius]MCM1395909.1 TrkA family potassium uptake protein [Candidatus Amulumruptor caecigallinarius]MCM1452944.1 TrkA family potassium uptake protein [bacterium]
MRFLIIGLGIYGYNLATDLTAIGHEVIGADIKPSLVESIKDSISTAYIIDSTDEVALSVLPLNNVDIVIVAIGENFGASVKTVALLKKLKVPHIYARAMDELHHSILEGFRVDRILTPEQRAASDLVHELALGTHVESMQVDSQSYVLKFTVPPYFIGTKINSIDFRKAYSLRVISITRPREGVNALGIEHREYRALTPDEDTDFREGDILVCYGTRKAFTTLFKNIN